jgi:hypothetical protein
MLIVDALQYLGLASSRARTRTLLRPFIIEAALARLDRRLTLDEQKVVMRAVGDARKVNWPDWWQAARTGHADGGGEIEGEK